MKANETQSAASGETEIPRAVRRGKAAQASAPKRCETCGNEYDRAFTVEIGGEKHVFDCFECAIHALAPMCEHCGCRVVGHGAEAHGRIYCCAHCAHASGVANVVDNAAHGPSA